MRTALIAGLLSAGAAVAAPTSPPGWSAPTDPFRVADNFYYVGTAGISAWLITTPKGHIVIDGAMPTSAPLIQSSIRRLGFQPKDVKILLNTHAHFDHTGGLADLKRERLKSGSTDPFVDPGELARRVAESEADFLKTLARQEASAK